VKAAIALAAVLLASSAAMSPIDLPGAEGGVGFDDLVFSRELDRIIAPAGRTGRLDLVHPGNGEVESIEGISRTSSPTRGHGRGTTSADAGQGYLFATDRDDRALVAVDARARRIVARIELAGGPDYVRAVGAAHEVWVTEPGRESIEVFAFEPGSPPRLEKVGDISVPGGPESLVVDPAGARAFTNDFGQATFAVDVSSHKVLARWANHCRGARGIALDAARGLVFVGCNEGKAVALDAAHGSLLGEARAGRGVDGIAYDPRLGHLYAPAAESASLTVIGVRSRGALEELGTIAAAPGSHCAAADDRGDVYVCDPGKGRLLALRDPYPASR
jgi:DNA-binding beta-propeller fold protein YncE